MGRRAFRAAPVGADYRIDIAACRALIEADIAAGDRPFAIVGNAGTVSTGAVDDLRGLRALADEFGLWLHIDGAFGSLAAWSESRALVEGQDLADSLAFDLHKWGYLPYEVGCVLTRDADAQLATYRSASAGGPAYLRSAQQGIAVDTTYFADRGLQLSRGFRALKVWMSLKELGADRLGAAIQRNIDQARRLGDLVDAHPDLERLAPVSMNIVCFRYAPAGLAADALDQLNQDILVALQVRGIAVPSQTVLNGRFALRVCITNHRSEDADFDLLLAAVTDIGAELSARGLNDRTLQDALRGPFTKTVTLYAQPADRLRGVARVEKCRKPCPPAVAALAFMAMPVRGLQRSEMTAADQAVPRYAHVFVIIEENKDYQQILNPVTAPIHVGTYAATYGDATQFFGEVHPSEANYVALLGGDTFGIHDDDAFYCRSRHGRSATAMARPRRAMPTTRSRRRIWASSSKPPV